MNTPPQTATLLKEIILSAKPILLKLTDTETFQKATPRKWSTKEILGHLIDSASNNHQRFVRAQFKSDMVFEGYLQAEWVRVQNYQSRSWNELVELWAQYNLQLAHVMHFTPKDIRFRSVSKHNLHQIAFKTVPEDELTSLEYFMVDYVAHLEHHLKQIFPNYETVLGSYENNFHIQS
ncbi:MAG: DinB family protein [Bacteroidota bacterium]